MSSLLYNYTVLCFFHIKLLYPKFHSNSINSIVKHLQRSSESTNSSLFIFVHFTSRLFSNLILCMKSEPLEIGLIKFCWIFAVSTDSKGE